MIFTDGRWQARTTPSGGNAQLSFQYGRQSDLPVVGDWDGNGSETPGVARFTEAGTWQWLLRNSNTGGGGNITFSFGAIRFVPVDRLGSIPIAGNLDPSDDEYEVGVVLYDYASGQLTWQIRLNLTPSSPVVSFVYGRFEDYPVVGDWDDNGSDTVGVVRSPNRWLLNNRLLAGGGAQLSFPFGSGDPSTVELPVVGDWDGDGTDTPAVLRNVPATAPEGPFQQWIFRNANSGGPASGSFVFGGAANRLSLPIEFVPRLAIEGAG